MKCTRNTGVYDLSCLLLIVVYFCRLPITLCSKHDEFRRSVCNIPDQISLTTHN